jgi:hypothetical protein
MVDRNPLLSVAFTLPIKEKPPPHIVQQGLPFSLGTVTSFPVPWPGYASPYFAGISS